MRPCHFIGAGATAGIASVVLLSPLGALAGHPLGLLLAGAMLSENQRLVRQFVYSRSQLCMAGFRVEEPFTSRQSSVLLQRLLFWAYLGAQPP
jgi:hypothetical protein